MADGGNVNEAEWIKRNEQMKASVDGVFKDYNESTEERLLAAGLDVYFRNVPMHLQGNDFLLSV